MGCSYWQTEYLSWDEDAYWQSFDVFGLCLGLDSLISPHIAVLKVKLDEY